MKRIVGLTDFLRGVSPEEIAKMDKLTKLEQKKIKDRLNAEILYE